MSVHTASWHRPTARHAAQDWDAIDQQPASSTGDEK